MELSMLIAKILALYYISVGIALLNGKINPIKMIEDFEKSPALTFITGLFLLVMGVLLVEYHNIWVKNWTVLITIVGWAVVIKGILLITFPEFISHFKGWYKNVQSWGIFIIAIGLLFGYFGFGL